MPHEKLLTKYEKLLARLDQKRSDHYTTRRIRAFLQFLGNPQYQYKTIHVAGTSGKGSVCQMLASVLQSAGYKTGLLISPYLVSPLEKVQINGENISRLDFCNLVKEFFPLIKKFRLTYFEAWIALSFIYLARKKVDWAVVETGLGGRLDATNVLQPELAIVTNIGLDHTEMLGHTLREIAKEKEAIIKDPQKAITGSPLIKKARLIKFKYRLKAINQKLTIFNYKSFKNIKLKLLGEHQIWNAILAIEAARFLKLPKRAIYQGLLKAKNHGRLQIIKKRPLVILDGAHNPEKVRVLLRSLKIFKYKRLILIVAIKHTKDYQKMLNLFCKKADYIIITTVPQSFPLCTLKKYLQKKRIHFLSLAQSQKALAEAISLAKRDDLILVTGSLYLVGEILKQVNRRLI